MLGYLTSRWQSAGDPKKTSPHWFDRHVSPILLSVAKKACTHPIHTIVFTALLASTTYLSVIESSLFNGPSSVTTSLGKADFNTLLAGSKVLRTGPATEWKWQADDDHNATSAEEVPTLILTLDPVNPSFCRTPTTSPS